MTMTPQLFRVNADDKTSVAVREVDFSELGLHERDDIQKWVAANPRILDQDLLVVTEEFSEFDKTDERLDLLAVYSTGNLVVIELKGDDTGADIDDVKRFLASVEALAQKDLPENLRLDKSYRPTQWGYWMFWYSRDPWKRWSLAYLIQLQKTTDILSSRAAPLLSGDVLKDFHEDWVAEVSLVYKPNAGLSERVLKTIDNPQVDEAQIAVEARDFRKIAIRIGADELDDEFVKRAAESLRNLIDTITPAVDRAL